MEVTQQKTSRHGCREVFGLSIFQAADIGTQSGELVYQFLITALNEVDMLHIGGALCSQTGNDLSQALRWLLPSELLQ